MRVDRDGVPDALGDRGDDRRRRRRARGRDAASDWPRATALGTLAFSERGTGAHFYAPELRAERENGGVRISGRKSFVTSGGHADVYLVLVQGEAEGTADAFLVRGDAAGRPLRRRLDRGSGWPATRASPSSSTASSVDDDARIGEAGAALGLVFGAVAPFFLVGLAAVNVGIARPPRQAATAHARDRRYPDGTLARRGAVRAAPARRHGHLGADGTAARPGGGPRSAKPATRAALVAIMEAKVAATEAATEVTQKALEATGGQGYTPALPIERHLRDARAGSVMAPTNAVLRSWIGKALAGLPGAMSSRDDTILVGAVAYHPRIVTIWEGFRDYFAGAGVPTDYVLYSNYERLVEALLERRGRHRLEHEHRLRRGRAPDRRRRARARDAGRRRGLPHRDRDAAGRGVRRSRRSSPASGSRSAAATPGTPRSCRCTTWPGRARRGTARRRSSASTPTSASTATPATPSCACPRPSPAARPTRARSGDATWARLQAERFAPVCRARGGVAQPDLLPLQLHGAARRSIAARASAWTRGAARDETTTTRSSGR